MDLTNPQIIMRDKEIAQLRAELAKERNKLEMAEAVIAGDGALITGLKNDLAAAQAVIEQMREKLTSCRSSIRQDLTNYERVLDDMDRSDQQHESAYDAVSKERTRLFRLLNYIDSLDSATISLDALHEDRARECERLYKLSAASAVYKSRGGV